VQYDFQTFRGFVAIRLEDERYAGLVIEVEDPSATSAAIEDAIGQLSKKMQEKP
jgi:hypothetical protein